jgi:microcystin-dependent protein
MATISVLNTDAGLTGKTITNLEDAQTVTGMKTFDRDPNPPFAVTSGSAAVANLDADKLDGQEGSYYLNRANHTGSGTEAFPIGGVFIAVVSTNPATLLGYGTWSAFGAGRVLVGLDSGQTEFDTVEETGGSKTHTLTTSEMPTHTHVQDAHAHAITDPGHLHTTNVFTQSGGGGSSTLTTGTISAEVSTDAQVTGITVNNQTATNQNAGSSAAHNNLQPYIVVYMWKRTA